MSRYQCNLPPELLEKAVNELNEPKNNDERLAHIDYIREEFKRQNPDVKLVQEDDSFILRFLRVRKFDRVKTLQTLKNYHAQRDSWPEVFDKVKNPVLLKHELEQGVVCPLEGKAKNGCHVVVMRPGLNNCNIVTDIAACMILTVEKLLEQEETQINGIVVINDMAYLTLDMAKQMGPSLAKKLTTTIQECLPLRIKSSNLTNQPKFFDLAYAIVYPLLKDKMKKRLQLHGQDFSKLFEQIDRSQLPLMFAGTGPEMDVQDWKEEILSTGTAL